MLERRALRGAPSAAGLQGGLNTQQTDVFTTRSSFTRLEVPLEGWSACKVLQFDYNKFLIQLLLSNSRQQAAKLLIQYACALCTLSSTHCWCLDKAFLRPSSSSYASPQKSNAQGGAGAVQTGGRQTALTSLHLFTAHNNSPTFIIQNPYNALNPLREKYQHTQLKKC